MTSNHFSALDGLRGLAAVIIAFGWHYQHFGVQDFFLSHYFPFVYNFGWLFVFLFFIISGFVINHVYQTAITTRQINFNHFVIKRLTRLYPLHITTLLTVSSLQLIHLHLARIFFVYDHNTLSYYLANLIFLQFGWPGSTFSFNGPSWTLPLELIAYLIFFIILALFRTHFRPLSTYAFFIFLPGFLAIYLPKLIHPFVTFALVGFFCGCFLHHLHTHFAHPVTRFLLLIAAALAFTVGSFHQFGPIPELHFIIFVFSPAIHIILELRPLSNFFSLPPLTYLGRVSFSLYMWHFPVQLFLVTATTYFHQNPNYHHLLPFAIYVTLTLLTAHLSYHHLEQPSQHYLRSRYLHS